MKILRYIYKAYWMFNIKIAPVYQTWFTKLLFLMNGVQYGKNLVAEGIPFINVSLNGSFSVGDNFIMHNDKFHNSNGRREQCMFKVVNDAKLTIGNNVGMSATAIMCHQKVTIGDNVMIGGNTVIYDTDFHSLKADNRTDSKSDKSNTAKAPVKIHDNVFIGSHCTILKGVTIGECSIVGSCSVVTKSIPPYQIWAGNPARFIREIKQVYETVSL